MTIDQLDEIAEWLSPLDKYNIRCDLMSTGRWKAESVIYMPSRMVYLYFDSESQLTTETTEGGDVLLGMTSVWEQICLRNL